jgi:hypothetical protein
MPVKQRGVHGSALRNAARQTKAKAKLDGTKTHYEM